jgi:hypothetical protein
MEMFLKVRFASAREKARDSKVRKGLKETRLGVGS